MKTVKRNILLTPGPATTTDTVKYAQVVPDVCPRELEFSVLLKKIRDSLVDIVDGRPDYACVIFGGSGTAAVDAVINSTVPKRKKIALIINGAYGDRMLKIAKAYNIDAYPIRYNYGQKLDMAEIEMQIRNSRGVSSIAVVHHETTTGILNDIGAIGRIAKKYKCNYIVDAISSYAGIPINVKDISVDYLIATSNKCLQGMPGVSFAVCRKKAIESISEFTPRSFYLDLYSQYEFLENEGQTQFTPPVQTLYSLETAISEYLREGGKERHDRYVENWETLKKGLLKLGFILYHEEKEESKLLITVYEPKGKWFNFNKFHDMLKLEGFTVYPGKVSKYKTFRIANIGNIFPRDIKNFLNRLFHIMEIMKESR